jgi:hypothetical protein
MTHITVPDQTPSADFAVVGSTADFALTFTIFDKTDLRVTVNGAEKLQADFDFVGTPGFEGGYPGGTVTLLAPVTNSAVRIWSEMPPARVNDFLEGPGLPARAVNTELDRLTARMRDVRLRFQRTPTIAHVLDHTLTADEAGQFFTNEGSSGQMDYTLPPASAGLKFGIAVVDNHPIGLLAHSGEYVGGSSTLTGSVIGSMICVVGTDEGKWLIESSIGTWA